MIFGNQEYDIGLGVEYIAANGGNAQTNPFGNAIRGGYSNYKGVNYEWFEYEPYAPHTLDFFGRQRVAIPVTEYLHGDYFGYRGIMPLALQSVSPEPYPYELPYPYNLSA